MLGGRFLAGSFDSFLNPLAKFPAWDFLKKSPDVDLVVPDIKDRHLRVFRHLLAVCLRYRKGGALRIALAKPDMPPCHYEAGCQPL